MFDVARSRVRWVRSRIRWFIVVDEAKAESFEGAAEFARCFEQLSGGVFEHVEEGPDGFDLFVAAGGPGDGVVVGGGVVAEERAARSFVGGKVDASFPDAGFRGKAKLDCAGLAFHGEEGFSE